MLVDTPMNAQDVAQMLGVGKNLVYSMASSGELPSYKIGRKLLFRREDIQAYLDKINSEGQDAASANTDLSDILDPHISKDAYVLSGEGLPADVFVEHLEMLGANITRTLRTSYAGIVELYLGKVDAAFISLYDQRTNTYNIPYIQRLAPGLPVVAFRLIGRHQGFAVAKGNPKKISSWGALLREGIKLANSPQGSASRILLDEKLLSLEADPYSIDGYSEVFSTELSAATAVATGLSDVTVVQQSTAAMCDKVDFIPLQTDWLDIVVAKRGQGRQLVRAVKDAFSNKAFRERYASITCGDMQRFGSIVYES